MKKIILTIIAFLALITCGGTLYFYATFPKVESAPKISVQRTPQQVARGKYLAKHVSVCIDCHSTRDWSKFSGPVTPGTIGKGGERFDQKMGLPGTFISRNITPYNLQDWTDGEIYRAITTGVTKEGNALFPVMPYPVYGKMDPRDVKAIIAYIRTLSPINYDPPKSEPQFPMNIILQTIPKPATPQSRPSPKDTVAYGKYMVTIAGCGECHTPQNQGQQIKGMYLAGGSEYQMPFGIIRSANITPDNDTGIGDWTQQKFINRFKQYDVPIDSLPAVSNNDFNSIMPWKMYAGMKVQDLKAIYAYLKTIPAVKHDVNKFVPNTELAASQK